MNNFNSSESLKMINELGSQLGSLMKIQKELFKQLPQEVIKQANFTNKDVKDIQDSIKNGDLSKLNELNKRYANSSNSK